MSRSIRSLVLAFLVASWGTASAAPAPDFIADLHADFVARDAALGGDAVSLVRLGFGVQAIFFLDNGDVVSPLGRLKLLSKVASHLEKTKPLGAYGRNGAGLPAALSQAILDVDPGVTAADARATSLPLDGFRTKMLGKTAQAGKKLLKAKNPGTAKAQDNVKWRTGKLIEAQTLVNEVNRKIDARAARPCDGDGTVTATIDGAAFRPTYAAVRTSSTQVQISGFFYDASAPNPYAGGSVDLLWNGVETFLGVGTYPIDPAHAQPTILLQYGGALYQAQSGTVTVTAYDHAGRRATGTFSGSLQASDATIKVVEGGAFNVCRFIDE